MPFGPNAINPGYGQTQNNPTGLSNEVIASNPAQTPGNFVITGGSIDGTPIGITTPSAAHFTTIDLNTPLAVADGGTGLSSTPTNGQLLIGNGSGFSLNTLTAGSGMQITNSSGTITLATTGGSGTVTSVDVSGGTTGLTYSGGPITSSGTITMAGTLAIANGGTGGTSEAAARSNLGVTATGADTTYAYRANNLSDLASAATARTNLGLGGLAVLNTINLATTATGGVSGLLPIANGGTGASTATDARTALGVSSTGSDTTYAFRANNLSDLASAATARTNLGLGSISTQAASNVAITGGSITNTPISGSTGSFTTLSASGVVDVNGTNGSLRINSDAGAISTLTFRDGTTNKYQIYKNTDNSFNIYNNAATAGIMTVPASNATATIYPRIVASGGMDGAIGATTPSTGAFTTLSASGLAGFTGAAYVQGLAYPTSGAGLELGYYAAGNYSQIQSYDRTGSAWKAINYNALSHTFNVSGSAVGAFSSTGLAVTGSITSSVANPVIVLNRSATTGYSTIAFKTGGATTGGWEIYGTNATNQNLNFYSYQAGATVAQLTSTGLSVTGTIVGSSTIKTAENVTWDFGAAATVSPTSPNRTLKVIVGGTTYYIAAKTTND